jgi:phenylpyruvate tautomerase PptA (4-oxalocrotonate tautomerase family)
MPLLRIDVIEGRSEAELKELLDAIHCAMLAAFKVPERDRYQIVHEHPAAEMRIEDTGLGIPRTERIVMVQVTTRPRSRVEKQNFYELLCQELLRRCEVKTSDVVVSITQNADEDWSFGYGRPSSLPENFDPICQMSGSHLLAACSPGRCALAV